MSALAVEQVYRYAQASAAGPGKIQLAGTPREQQPFFAGELAAPRRAADLMLTLVHVVNSRFYIAPGMLARILANADPVITFGGGLLRLEGFSACCGVYSRVDLLPSAYDAERAEPGTTNVDFNPPMRAALSRIRDRESARLSVSAGEVELETGRGTAVERKVKLPVRWLKGFVEVQAHQSRMSPRFTLNPAGTQRFLRDIPRTPVRGEVHVAPAGPVVRMSQSAMPGAVPVGGIERLRVLDPIARHAKSLTVYAADDGATGWELSTADARFFLALSPAPSRGFSGEGQALHQLASEPAERALGGVRGALRWQATLDPATLAAELGIGGDSVVWALAQLGASGLVGYDLAARAFFHRELPFDLSLIEQLQPRLKDARKLVAGGGVRIEGETGEAWVRGTGVEHRVRRVEGDWALHVSVGGQARFEPGAVQAHSCREDSGGFGRWAGLIAALTTSLLTSTSLYGKLFF